MQIRLFSLALLGLLLLGRGTARADIPAPLPKAKNDVGFKVEVDANAKGPRLVVPNGVFTAPRVRPFPPKGAIENEDGDGIAEAPAPRNNRLIFAGVALALSASFGGVWFLRRSGRSTPRSMGLMIAFGAVLTLGTLVVANAPPPINPRPPVKKEVALPTAYDGKVQVEFVYGNEPIRLILDKATLEKLQKVQGGGAPAPLPSIKPTIVPPMGVPNKPNRLPNAE